MDKLRTPRVHMHLCKYEIIFDPNTHCKSSFSTVSLSSFILPFHRSLSFIPNYELLLLPNNNQKSPDDIMRN